MVAGITGSAGKSTTTALAGLMAKTTFEMKSNRQKAWVGGNIGNPLIDYLDQIGEDDLAIMELSSFQLELMKNSPQVAAVLNITPNHLDRHHSMDAYIDAKSHILWFQKADDIAILNRDDEISWDWFANQRRPDQLRSHKPDSRANAPFRPGFGLAANWQGKTENVPVEWIQLRGKHNLSISRQPQRLQSRTLAQPAIHQRSKNFVHPTPSGTSVSTMGHLDQRFHRDRSERTMLPWNPFRADRAASGGRDQELPWDKLRTSSETRWNATSSL
jgi:hypothetical protein